MKPPRRWPSAERSCRFLPNMRRVRTAEVGRSKQRFQFVAGTHEWDKLKQAENWYESRNQGPSDRQHVARLVHSRRAFWIAPDRRCCGLPIWTAVAALPLAVLSTSGVLSKGRADAARGSIILKLWRLLLAIAALSAPSACLSRRSREDRRRDSPAAATMARAGGSQDARQRTAAISM